MFQTRYAFLNYETIECEDPKLLDNLSKATLQIQTRSNTTNLSKLV